ncbi:MAG: polysaccharide deacetylase family protein [Clostridiales bacterium]
MSEESPKKICISMSVLAVFAVIVCCFIFQGENELIGAVMGESAEKPIYAVATTENKIAFSFDATWGAEHTEEILNILDKYKVKTTFFLVNIWLDEYPEMAKKIHERGHEIQLHSASHPYFTNISTAAMEGELKENNAKIKELIGMEGTLFRPPFGDYNNDVLATAHSLRLEVIQWSVDSLDWENIAANEIYNRVNDQVTKGSIVLFHNNGLHTAEALETLIPQLQSKGFEIVPVSALIYKENYTVDNNGIQKQK